MTEYACTDSGADIEIGFSYFDEDDPNYHLCFVASRTDDLEVVVMNFTSGELHKDGWKEQTCVVVPGEHRWIRKRTVVMYRAATIQSMASIRFKINTGRYLPQDPLGITLLQRVWDGASRSDFIPGKVKQKLAEMGHICD